MRLFSFSLKDKAKVWLNFLKVGNITSWDILTRKFLNKYFFIHKTTTLRREIASFMKKDGEQFYNCWERWKDLLLKCAHHGFEKWQLSVLFLSVFDTSVRSMVDATCGASLMSKSDIEAWDFFETLSENSQQWGHHLALIGIPMNHRVHACMSWTPKLN